MEMEDQFGISDLRHFISRAAVGPNHFPPYPQPHLPPSSDLFPTHHNHRSGLSAAHPMIVMGRSMPATADMLHLTGNNNNNHNNNCNFHLQHTIHHPFNSDSTTTTTTTTTTAAAAATTYSGGFDVGDGSAARWPRQETLTLLEIRSRLDHKFKDANQKGPLWDEVARIMCEEHGYQRTGKKCREKFENLYKYYKKTKEGKAGRQDGKHYRFFRQLEALYGDHHNNTHLHHHHHHHHITGNTPHLHIPNNDTNNNTTTMIPTTSDNNNNNHHNNNINASVSLSNTSDYDTSSSSDGDVGPASLGEGSGDDAKQKKMKKKKEKKRGKRSWKAKIKEFIDHQMRKIMDKQEAWLEKMMNTLESRERERIEREEEWRKQEIERVDKEHKFWASERAWIEARDSALMSALEKITTTTTTRDDKDASGFIGGYGSGGNLIVARDRDRDDRDHDQWLESEVTRLIQLRTSMESRFQQCGFSEEVLWEDIAAKMAYLGYDRSPIVCKEKWDYINKIFQQKDNNNNNTSIVIRDYNNNEGVNKKRKENYDEVSNNNHTHSYTTTTHYHNNDSMLYINHQMGGFNNNNNSHHNSNYEINEPRLQLNEGSSSSPSSHNSNANLNVNVNANASGGVAGGAVGAAGGGGVMNDSCLRFFLGSEGRPWLGE